MHSHSFSLKYDPPSKDYLSSFSLPSCAPPRPAGPFRWGAWRLMHFSCLSLPCVAPPSCLGSWNLHNQFINLDLTVRAPRTCRDVYTISRFPCALGVTPLTTLIITLYCEPLWLRSWPPASPSQNIKVLKIMMDCSRTYDTQTSFTHLFSGIRVFELPCSTSPWSRANAWIKHTIKTNLK